ncbi:MAG: radical SAM protein [Acidobacteriota bacterium]
MRVLLISMPDSICLYRWAQAFMPNLGISSIAANVDRTVFEVRLLDLLMEPYGVRRTVKQIVEEYRPHIVGLTAMSFQMRSAVQIAGLAKSIDTSIVTVLGGYHATLAYEDIAPGSFDFLVRGEGEATARELFEMVESGGRAFEQIAGLSFRSEERWVHNRPRALLDPSSIALPDRESRVFGHRDGLNGNIDSIETSRGCRLACSFCCIRQMYGQSFRTFPIPRVIEDIRRARSLGAHRIFFSDDNITTDVERFKSLCQAIVDTGLNNIRYSTQASVLGISSSEDLVRMMRDANFTLVFIGIEGLSEQKLRFVKKGNILDRSLRAIELLHKHGIQIMAGFITGLPDDRPEDVRDVFRFVQRNRIAVPYVLCSTPYPKTPFGDELVRERLVIDRDNYDLYNCWATNVRTRHMSRLRLSFERSLGYFKFVFRTAVLGDNHYVRKIREEDYFAMVLYRLASIVVFCRLITGTWQTVRGTHFYSWWEWPRALHDRLGGVFRRTTTE